jgi:hypothetical protein
MKYFRLLEHWDRGSNPTQGMDVCIYSVFLLGSGLGRSIAKRLVADFPPRRPEFKPGSGQVEFVVDKVAVGAGFLRVLRFPLPIFNPTNSPSSYSPGAFSGRRAEWTHLDSSPHYANLKKN